MEGGETARYAVEIEAVREDPAQCRDLRLLVTDPRLLERTGGIVQGAAYLELAVTRTHFVPVGLCRSGQGRSDNQRKCD